MADYAFTSLPVHLIRDEEQGAWRWGVEVHGTFLEFGRRKLGGWDDDIARGRKAEAEQAAAAPPPEQTPTQ